MSDLSQASAAKELGCSVRTIERIRNKGRFPHAYKLNGHWRIPRQDLDEYRRTQRPTTAKRRKRIDTSDVCSRLLKQKRSSL